MLTKKSVLAASGIFLLAWLVVACASSNPNTPNALNFSIEATDSGCSPTRIEVDQGIIMNLALRNTSSREISFNFPEESYTVTAPAGQTVAGNFVSPTDPGTYPFTCGPTGGGAGTTSGDIHVK